MPPPATADPAQKIVIGRFAAPFGVQGWMRIIVFGSDAVFSHNRHWWCAPAAADSWQCLQVEEIRPRSRDLLVKLSGIDERQQAEQWTNGSIAVSRNDFPPVATDEYYWCDLLGLQALDMDGVALGQVSGLMRTGAHDILRIAAADNGKEVWVPFVEAHVAAVDAVAGRIHLYWRRDW